MQNRDPAGYVAGFTRHLPRLQGTAVSVIRAGAIIGALLALVFGDYHNEHVNVLAGGWVFSGGGFVLLAAGGAFIGAIIVTAISPKSRPPGSLRHPIYPTTDTAAHLRRDAEDGEPDHDV